MANLPVCTASHRGLQPEPEEPLAESAPLAWVEAPRRCARDPETGESCISYHRVWQYLRLLGVITSTRTNTDFLTARFRECARAGCFPRALVSAAADYSMLAHLKRAYDAEGVTLDATVIDRCGTSLFLNRWYASRYGFPVTTECSKVVDYTPARGFDLVCTHNLLGFHDSVARRQIVARWHALLRPGGLVVTVQRVEPNATVDRNPRDEHAARALSARVAAACRSFPLPLGIDPGELSAAGYEYAIRNRTYVIRTMKEMTDLFETEGFVLELADAGGGRAEREQDRPAQSLTSASFRMRIVARKP